MTMGPMSVVSLSVLLSVVQLEPVSPPGELALTGVTVTIAEVLEGDKKEILEELEVPETLARVLMDSFQKSGDASLRLLITEFRVGWGAARMHVVGEVVGADGTVTKKVEADSTSVRGGRIRKRVQRVAQDIVNKLVAALKNP